MPACTQATRTPSLLHSPPSPQVKTLTGKEIEIDIEPTDTVQRIKERVEEKEGIPPVQQRWVLGAALGSCHDCGWVAWGQLGKRSAGWGTQPAHSLPCPSTPLAG